MLLNLAMTTEARVESNRSFRKVISIVHCDKVDIPDFEEVRCCLLPGRHGKESWWKVSCGPCRRVKCLACFSVDDKTFDLCGHILHMLTQWLV